MFLDARARRKADEAAGVSSSGRTATFLREAGRALKTYWARCILAILLMTGFNFFSHGSQDLYPTYIQVRACFDRTLILSVEGLQQRRRYEGDDRWQRVSFFLPA